MNSPDVNLWRSTEHVLEYLSLADAIPHRIEGERVLLECLPESVSRVLDVGSGDGRLLDFVKRARPQANAVALDFSPPMIERLQTRFGADGTVRIVVHDFDAALPASLGQFDVVVSSFAIHHVHHERKRSLYSEVYNLLTPSGLFCNLEHVASPTTVLHHQFLGALSLRPEQEDPSNKLLDVHTQLEWLREIGFIDVDCLWKWRELALLVGTKPGDPDTRAQPCARPT